MIELEDETSALHHQAQNLKEKPSLSVSPKLYKRRWIIIFLYILYSAINAFQWFEYSIVANIVMKYYNISAVSVDWTSIIYMALYMPMVLPASYFMQKKGLRTIVLIGVLGTALGTIVKIFSLNRENGIWITYLAQSILSSMQVFILALPPRIASIWFGPKEVSLACALGVFGTQLGQGLGFLIPPLVIKNHENVEEIGSDFKILFYGLSIISALLATAIIIYFPDRPPKPAQHQNQHEKIKFSESLKLLFCDKGFNFHAIAYGINIGVFLSISTLLNQFILFYFPNSEEDAGTIGLLIIILGMIASIIFGSVLDKTHAYKQITVGMYSVSLVGVLAFMFSLQSASKVLVYISGLLLGVSSAYLTVGLELAIELTYPEPESTSSGILISMTQTLGVIFTLVLGYLNSLFGSFWALASMLCFLFLGLVLTIMIPNVLKRQNAFKQLLRISKNIEIPT